MKISIYNTPSGTVSNPYSYVTDQTFDTATSNLQYGTHSTGYFSTEYTLPTISSNITFLFIVSTSTNYTAGASYKCEFY